MRKKSKRKSGGQKNHAGHTLEQVEYPNFVQEHFPEKCTVCNKNLKDTPHTGNYKKRQVFDIPPCEVEVTEHRIYEKICKCGCKNQAAYPKGVSAATQYGSRLQAYISYLSVQQLIPEKRIQEMLEECFNISISTGTIGNILVKFGKKAAILQAETLDIIKKQEKLKHLDETGCSIYCVEFPDQRWWIHVISTPDYTHYRVSRKRSDLEPLKDIKGYVVHDGWKSYFKIKDVVHVSCNAHHLRELNALFELDGELWAKKMSELLLEMLTKRDQSSTPKGKEEFLKNYDFILEEGFSYHARLKPLPRKKGKRPKNRTGYNLLMRLKNYKECVVRFFMESDVPFTNNQAERDIRMLKVKKKISGCFRSVRGAKIFMASRGFISTMRKQKKNILNGITEVLAAA